MLAYSAQALIGFWIREQILAVLPHKNVVQMLDDLFIEIAPAQIRITICGQNVNDTRLDIKDRDVHSSTTEVEN